MRKRCIAAIDQGTSSTRVMLFDSHGAVLSVHQMEHTQYYPKEGWVEHDPSEIWDNVKICMAEAWIKAGGHDIEVAGVGITNQRETTVVWDRETGLPLHRAIVWNDGRTNGIVESLVNLYGSKDFLRNKTGLPIASYFSATKIIYLLQNVPNLQAYADQGRALFGTIDSWLIWKLTNGRSHVTDVTNASRTLLMNLKTLNWDESILSLLEIPIQMLPKICPSSHIFGYIDMPSCDGYHNSAIGGVLGDQQAALFGQICHNSGDAKCTYGTGAFLLMNTGHEIVHSSKGLLTTVAYQLANGAAVYALEGSVAYSGSLLQWLRDNLQILASANESENIASTVNNNGGVYFVPAFSGLYAPYWREDACAVVVGLTAFNTKAHIVRAALEASAFQVLEVVDAMSNESGQSKPISSLKVDGGSTVNEFLMQFQCDLIQRPLVKPLISETTCLGAAFIAGLGVGLWSDISELAPIWRVSNEWQPRMPRQVRAKLVHGWQKAVARSLFWRDNAEFDENGDLKTLDTILKDPYIDNLKQSIPPTPEASNSTAKSSELFAPITTLGAIMCLTVGFLVGLTFSKRS